LLSGIKRAGVIHQKFTANSLFSGTKVASSGGVKVFSSAEQPVAGKGPRVAPSAKPVVIRTVPFTFRSLIGSLVVLCGAAALIYWVGSYYFHRWVEDGSMEFSRFGIGVVAFGVVMLCWSTIKCWKYFDPYPELRISPGAAPLGASFDVEWSFRGAKGRLQKLAMTLEGREEVMAENKTGKQAEPQKLTAPFYIAALQMPEQKGHGHVHVKLPEGMMPTMEAEKTKIIWLLRFESQIKWGPKLKYEFPVRVLPGVANG
jgi:hypothetical protein